MRNITQLIHQNYWKECVKCIRNYHQEKIIIIDDNSKILCNKEDELMFDNIEVIYSENHLRGCGEILAYYYAYHNKPFKQIIILHDSVFIQKKIDNVTNNVLFLWHFDKYLNDNNEIRNYIYKNNYNNHKDEIISSYNNPKWVGCFGVMSIIKLDFLEFIFNKYNFMEMILNCKTRKHREALERLFAIICFSSNESLNTNSSLFGNILMNYPWGINWNDYQNMDLSKYPAIKIFSAR